MHLIAPQLIVVLMIYNTRLETDSSVYIAPGVKPLKRFSDEPFVFFSTMTNHGAIDSYNIIPKPRIARLPQGEFPTQSTHISAGSCSIPR